MKFICLTCYDRDGTINYCEGKCNVCGNTTMFIKDNGTKTFSQGYGVREKEFGTMEQFSSEATNELYAALAKAQGKFKTVIASRKVSITTKAGATYTYNYATLATIMDMVREPLSENGLSISQPIYDDSIYTILGHSSGQFTMARLPLPESVDIKQLGANISYLRRYMITALVGITVDEEDDEAVADASLPQRRNQPQQSYRPPQPPPNRPTPPQRPVQEEPKYQGEMTGYVPDNNFPLRNVGDVRNELFSLGYGSSTIQDSLIKKIFGETAKIDKLTPLQQYNLFGYAKRSRFLDNAEISKEDRLKGVPEVADAQEPITTLEAAKDFIASVTRTLSAMEKPLRDF